MSRRGVDSRTRPGSYLYIVQPWGVNPWENELSDVYSVFPRGGDRSDQLCYVHPVYCRGVHAWINGRNHVHGVRCWAVHTRRDGLRDLPTMRSRRVDPRSRGRSFVYPLPERGMARGDGQT